LKTNYIPKLLIIVLALAAGFIFFSTQPAQAFATPSSPQYGCSMGYYNSSYYYWYGYPYYYYDYYGPYYCNSYYGSYYGYYPSYYYGYNYPYNYYGYDYNYYGYNYNYYTPPSNYQLTIATDPANLGTVTGGGTFSQGTSASFSVTRDTIQVSPTVRYIFSHWSGDYSGMGSTGTVTMNGAKKITAVYQQQFKLDVGAQPQGAPLPQGSGWYNAGDTVTVVSGGQMIGSGDDASRLVFLGWNLDGQTSQSDTSVMINMGAPHAVTAEYKQQYYLKVLTDQGSPFGEGWYDAGTTAQIYVSSPVSTAYGISIVFNGWQGDLQSGSQSSSVVMDKAKTVIASWRSDTTVRDWTIALGIVAAVLVAAGIIAYVALNSRNRYKPTALKPVPKSTPMQTTVQNQSAPTKKRVIPTKKKPTPPPPEDTNANSAPTQ
jgi:hypothetical protein